MLRELFVKIVEACEANYRYFTRIRNRAGPLGFIPYQKIPAVVRVIAYGFPADYTDEYLCICEDTTIKLVWLFVKMMIRVLGLEYLRSPNEEDTIRLMAMNEKRGWPGILGSIDCMHWKWKNCPKAWHGLYCGKSRDPTIVLEAVASHDLWNWHYFFGLPGSLGDINVLHRSHYLPNLQLQSCIDPITCQTCNYKVNGHDYTLGYYLADGIYLSWETDDPQV
jgi:hypothetical protein